MKLSLTIPEAAEATGQTEKAVRAAIKAGHLRAKWSSKNDQGDGCGKYLVTVKALETWIDGLVDA